MADPEWMKQSGTETRDVYLDGYHLFFSASAVVGRKVTEWREEGREVM